MIGIHAPDFRDWSLLAACSGNVSTDPPKEMRVFI
jgi:hypothetical protein